METDKRFKATKLVLGAAAVTAATVTGAATTAHADIETGVDAQAPAPKQDATVTKSAAEQTADAKADMNNAKAANDAAQQAADATAKAKADAQAKADQTANDVKNAQNAVDNATQANNDAQKAADEATPDAIAKANQDVNDANDAVKKASNAADTDAKMEQATKDQKADLDQKVNEAQANVDKAQKAVDDANTAMDTTGAQKALDDAKSKEATAKNANDQANDAVTSATTDVNKAQQALDQATAAKTQADQALANAQAAAQPSEDAIKTAQDKANTAQTAYNNAKAAYDAAVAAASQASSGININNAADGLTVEITDKVKAQQLVDQINNAKQLGYDDNTVKNLANQLEALVKLHYTATDHDWDTAINLPIHEGGFSGDVVLSRANSHTLPQNIQDELQMFLNASMNKIIKTLGLHYGTFMPSRTAEKIFFDAVDKATVKDNQALDGTMEDRFDSQSFQKHYGSNITQALIDSGLDYDATTYDLPDINNSFYNGANNGSFNSRENADGSFSMFKPKGALINHLTLANLKYAFYNGILTPTSISSGWGDYVDWTDFNYHTNRLSKPNTIMASYGNNIAGTGLTVVGGTPDFYGEPTSNDPAAKAKVEAAKTALDKAQADLTKANDAVTQAKNAAAITEGKVKDAQNAADAAKKNVDDANAKLATQQAALKQAQDHANTTAKDLATAQAAVTTAQKNLDDSKQDVATKQQKLHDAKLALVKAQAMLSAAKIQQADKEKQVKLFADQLVKDQAALKTAQDNLKVAQDKADRLSNANANLAKTKATLDEATKDLAAKQAANDAAQAALKTASDNDAQAQAKAREAKNALDKATDRYNMLLALQVAQERDAAKKNGYHAHGDQVLDANGHIVSGWHVDANGNLVDEDGNVVVKAEKQSSNNESFASQTAVSTSVMSSRRAVSGKDKSSTLPQTGDNNRSAVALALLGVSVAFTGMLGLRKRN